MNGHTDISTWPTRAKHRQELWIPCIYGGLEQQIFPSRAVTHTISHTSQPELCFATRGL